MATESGRDAAAFFTRFFRAAISADEASEQTQIFQPIIIGFLGGPISADEGSPPDRVMLFHPISRRVALLRGDPSLLSEMFADGTERKGPPPASVVSIEALPRAEIADAGEECAVCLDELGKTEICKEMPCKHQFHGNCIDKWLGFHGTCPVCRYCMPAEENTAKKADDDAEEHMRERAIWFEITFGSEGSGDRNQGLLDQQQQQQQQQIGEQIVDENSA